MTNEFPPEPQAEPGAGPAVPAGPGPEAAPRAADEPVEHVEQLDPVEADVQPPDPVEAGLPVVGDPADEGADDDGPAGEGSHGEGSEDGHPLVEETMSRLADLRDKPVGEHGEVYADIHERLQSALAEADGQGPDSADRA